MNEEELLQFVRKCRPFGLKPLSSKEQVQTLLKFAGKEHFEGDPKNHAPLFEVGSPSDKCYFVLSGSVQLRFRGVDVFTFQAGETFGEIGLLEGEKRRGSARIASPDTILLSLSRKMLDQLPGSLLREVYGYLGKRVTRLLLADEFYRRMDVLLIQDGGCAPGYNCVTSFLAEKFEKCGRRVFVALEGFKSVASGNDTDFGLLVFDEKMRRLLSNIPRMYDAAKLKNERGASFRAERFPAFKEAETQEKAVNAITNRGVSVVVCIGGNGTMKGAQALAERLRGTKTQVFFVPVTIDSDIFGTECIGEHTGVEQGAEKLRCYIADAYTHQRCYIKELMGADSGYHALHSAVGAGAHYAALSDPLSPAELERIAVAISMRRSTVIAVAEGYARQLRKEMGKDIAGVAFVASTSGRPGQKDLMSAATFLHYQLKSTGKLDPKKKVVCESFARDIRGAAPNNRDIFLSQQFAEKVVRMANEGITEAMPAVNSGKVTKIQFPLKTWNGVDEETMKLADRL